jgi:hypothetical protein
VSRLLLCLAALLAALAAAAGADAAAPPRPGNGGVYVGPADPGKVDRFARWSGERVDYVLEFPDRQHWSGIVSPWFIPRIWGPASRSFRHDVLVLSVPMLPGGRTDLAAGAAGAYDGQFRTLARKLAAAGLGKRTIVRLGWEFNAGWAGWSAAKQPAAYVAYFRRIVTTMRSVAPGLRFDWCPAEGLGQFWGIPGGLAAAYPGDAYVDYVGLDVYDQAWGRDGEVVADPLTRWRHLVNEPGGLAWQARFAAAHRKPLSFPEWALTRREDGHGGGDDPTFIEQMHAWIASHDVAYQAYFDHDAPDGDHELENGQFPAAAAAFRRLFGGPS